MVTTAIVSRQMMVHPRGERHLLTLRLVLLLLCGSQHCGLVGLGKLDFPILAERSRLAESPLWWWWQQRGVHRGEGQRRGRSLRSQKGMGWRQPRHLRRSCPRGKRRLRWELASYWFPLLLRSSSWRELWKCAGFMCLKKSRWVSLYIV